MKNKMQIRLLAFLMTFMMLFTSLPVHAIAVGQYDDSAAIESEVPEDKTYEEIYYEGGYGEAYLLKPKAAYASVVPLDTDRPPAPTAATVTTTSIVINVIPAPSGWATRYRMRPTGGDWSAWSVNRTFTGLSVGGVYQFEAIFLRASDSTLSATSPIANIRTAVLGPAPAPTAATITTTSITINPISAPSGWAARYRMRSGSGDWSAWSVNRTFTGLPADTVHEFEAIFVRESDSAVSTVSPIANIRTAGIVPAPAPTAATITTTSIVINVIPAPSGWATRYRMRPTGGDWSAWSVNRTFTGLSADTVYQFEAVFLRESDSAISTISSIANIRTAAIVTAPAPTASMITTTSIVLYPIPAPSGWVARYRMRSGGGEWTAWSVNRTFTGLSVDTAYEFEAVFLRESDSALSIVSPTANIRTTVIGPPPTPTAATITMTTIILNEITAPSGWITRYRIRPAGGEWVGWTDNYTFTGLTRDTVYEFQAVFLRESDRRVSTVSSINSARTREIAEPPAPTLSSGTPTTIILNAIPAPSGWGTRYRIRTVDGEWSAWQSSPDFTGLVAGTTYEFQAAFRNESAVVASGESPIARFTTPVIGTPPAPTLSSRVGTTVTLVTIPAPAGWTTQYRMGNGAWVTGTAFTVTTGGTYNFYARFVQGNWSSAVSPALVVPPVAGPQFIWGDADDNGVVNNTDIFIMRLFLAGLIEPPYINLLNANVTETGTVSNTDIFMIRLYLAGLFDPHN